MKLQILLEMADRREEQAHRKTPRPRSGFSFRLRREAPPRLQKKRQKLRTSSVEIRCETTVAELAIFRSRDSEVAVVAPRQPQSHQIVMENDKTVDHWRLVISFRPPHV